MSVSRFFWLLLTRADCFSFAPFENFSANSLCYPKCLGLFHINQIQQSAGLNCHYSRVLLKKKHAFEQAFHTLADNQKYESQFHFLNLYSPGRKDPLSLAISHQVFH